MMTASRTSEAECTPFFVEKKNEQIRLVWDCRVSNTHFRPPPPLELGAAEAVQRLTLDASDTLYIAQADVQNCFYQIKLPDWMVPYFTWSSCSGLEARSMGLNSYPDGSPVLPDDLVYPALKVLPMGFTWAFWIVQQIHQETARECGFGPERCLVGAWPPPKDLVGGRRYALL